MSDRYDELHDDNISALYRETRAVEPPAWLDRHVLTAAKAAVESRPVSARPPSKRRATRWAVPLGLAATVVLTVGVVRMVRESGQFEASLRQEAVRSSAEPAAEADAAATGRAELSAARKLPEAALPAAPPTSAFSLESRTRAPVASPPARLGDERLPPAPSIAPAAAPPSPPAKPAARKQESMAPADREKNDGPGVARPPLEETKAAGAADRLHRRSPERWLQEIAELRRQGRIVEADASLAEFRRRYPDHPLDKATTPR